MRSWGSHLGRRHPVFPLRWPCEAPDYLPKSSDCRRCRIERFVDPDRPYVEHCRRSCCLLPKVIALRRKEPTCVGQKAEHRTRLCREPQIACYENSLLSSRRGAEQNWRESRKAFPSDLKGSSCFRLLSSATIPSGERVRKATKVTHAGQEL